MSAQAVRIVPAQEHEEERSAILLAGGRSRRMGRNKAFLLFGGEPLVRRIADVLFQLTSDVAVVISREHQLNEYAQVLPPQTRIVQDDSTAQSPVIGIATGLRIVRGAHTIILSCDSPFVNLRVLHMLSEAVRGADAAIPRWPDGQVEPLHAVYRTAPTARAAVEAAAQGEFRNTDIIKRLSLVNYVPTDSLRAVDPELHCFFNVNTPEEFERAEALLRMQKPH